MDSYFQTVLENSAVIVYSILFLLIFLENILPFVPGDAVLIFSAYLSGRGVLLPSLAFGITITGSIVGFIFIFALSRHWGREYFENKKFSFLPIWRIDKIDRHFYRFGAWFLAIGRFIPGSRLLLALTAGFSNISYSRALAYTVSGILLWNGMIFNLGKIVGENWTMIKSVLSKYNTIVNSIIIVLLAGLVIWGTIKRSKKKEPVSGD
ncbi:DedA family protein [bacterium]|nr:DedA family protein [bacterium]